MPEKRKVSASEIFEELVTDFRIKDKIGSVQIELGGITAKYDGKDAIGDLLQEWIKNWFDSQNYFYRTKSNTQEFPDFLLEDSDDTGLLEIKTFNADAIPSFDIANFDAYCKSLLIKPERLDADYLIISYKMIDTELSIDNVWLKKVWEIAGTSTTNGVSLQIKNKKIDNIRPVQWFNDSKRIENKPFTSILDFITEISKVHDSYSQCNTYKEKWLDSVRANYFNKTGVKL